MLSRQEESSLSLDLFLSKDDESVASCPYSDPDQQEREDRKTRHSDTRPCLPQRQASSNDFELDRFMEAELSFLSLGDSLLSCDATISSDCENDKVVPRTKSSDFLPRMPRRSTRSSDFLPQIPRRRSTGRHTIASPLPIKEIRVRRPHRAPPASPHRQESGEHKKERRKSFSSPSLPLRSPSFNSCTGSAA